MFGEMGEELLLKGQKVLPEKLLKSGYTFQYPTLSQALSDILD
jgi:NAD dependent epimerase/dehydratase family enzyme